MKMYIIIGGAKTAYNLYKLFQRNNIDAVFYYFKGEFGAKKAGGKPIHLLDDKVINNGNIIVSSETAFVYLREKLHNKLPAHYYLRDKNNYPKIAEKLGIETIKEYSPGTIVFPVFLKPRQSGEGKVPFKTKLITTNEELIKHDQYLNYCTLQEYLTSKEYKQISIAGYFTGSADSLISVKQLNQYPLGVSSFVSYFSNSQLKQLKEFLSDYLKTLDYKGFIEVEFKWNINTGKFILMDINPRPWGWFYYYTSAVKNLKQVIKLNEQPAINIQKSWVNLPRLVLSNLKGKFINPPVKDFITNKICYEPYF
ncbi:MAG: hypothetical protein ACOCUL_02910 [Bacteroidota bacterium]